LSGLTEDAIASLTGQDKRALACVARCWQLYAASDEQGADAALSAIHALTTYGMQRSARVCARALIAFANDWSDIGPLWALVGCDMPEDGLAAGLVGDSYFGAAQVKQTSERNGKPGSADDPPWHALTEALSDVESELRAAVHRLSELDESFDDWAEHCKFYNGRRPEDVTAECLVAAVQPRLYRWLGAAERTEGELGRWLLADETARRMLRRAASCVLLWLTDGELAKERGALFVRNVRTEVMRLVVDDRSEWGKPEVEDESNTCRHCGEALSAIAALSAMATFTTGEL
jgi:hypothetical protein